MTESGSRGPGRNWLVAVCGLIIVVAVISLFRMTRDKGSPVDRDRFESAAVFAAAEAAAFMGEGKRVVLMVPDTSVVEHYRLQVEQFEKALKRQDVKVLGRETMVQNDEGSYYPLWGIGTSGRDIMDHTAAYEDVDYVVSLVYVPIFTIQDIKTARATKFPPMIVALTQGYQTGVTDLVQVGIVELGILTGLPSTSDRKPTTPQDQFRRRYRMVTRENVRELRM